MTDAPTPQASAEAVWRAAVARVTEGAGGDAPAPTRSADGIPVGPLYPAAKGAALDRAAGGHVKVAARADHPDPDEARALARADLDNGADGLVLALEGAATGRGFGLRLRTGEQLFSWLAEIERARVGCRLEAPPFAARDLRDGLARWVAHHGVAADIAFGLDPIGDMARTGTAPLPWSGTGRTLAGELSEEFVALRAHAAEGTVLEADGRPHHEAGASEAEELAAVVATALAYWRALDAAGLDATETRGALGFTLAADTDLFLSLAKLRALRHLWNAVEVACGLAPLPVRLHAETAWRTLSRRDPHTNLLRGTIGSAAAVLGGADSVTVLPFTQALGLPDGAARRLARNTALVLLEEAGLGRVRDPGAGSGAVEALTGALCEAAWAILRETEAAGGLPAMLASGAWQRRLAATRAVRHASLATGESVMVGVTRFTSDASREPTVLMPCPEAAPAPGRTAFPPLPSIRDAEAFEVRGGAP